MLECLSHLLLQAVLEFVKQWLRDWGNLLLTAVIAIAGIMQGIFAMRLYKLQESIEQSQFKPFLFCRVTGNGYPHGGAFTSLDAQLSNLSLHGVWVERLEIILDGPIAKPEMNFKIERILPASQTEVLRFCEMPFAEIVPIGAGMPSGPVKFKLQAKFYYSTASTLGSWYSPLYEVTIGNTIVTSLKNI